MLNNGCCYKKITCLDIIGPTRMSESIIIQWSNVKTFVSNF